MENGNGKDVSRLFDHRAAEARLLLNLECFPPERSQTELNVILQALPLPSSNGQCKIVLRPYDPDKAKAEDDEKQTNIKKFTKDKVFA